MRFLKPNVNRLSEKGDVKGLLRAMKYKIGKPDDSAVWIRETAVMRLMSLGVQSEEFKEALQFSLVKDNFYPANTAAGALGVFDDDGVTRALINAIPLGYGNIFYSLGRIGSGVAIQALIDTVEHGDVAQKIEAIEALWVHKIEDDGVLDVLVETLFVTAEGLTDQPHVDYDNQVLMSKLVYALVEFGNEALVRVRKRLAGDDELLKLLTEVDPYPAAWRRFLVPLTTNTVYGEEFLVDEGAVCDICGWSLYPFSGFFVRATDIKHLVERGFDPLTLENITTPDGRPLRAVGDALGLSIDEQRRDWQQKVATSQGDWLLCRICTVETIPFQSQAGNRKKNTP